MLYTLRIISWRKATLNPKGTEGFFCIFTRIKKNDNIDTINGGLEEKRCSQSLQFDTSAQSLKLHVSWLVAYHIIHTVKKKT